MLGLSFHFIKRKFYCFSSQWFLLVSLRKRQAPFPAQGGEDPQHKHDEASLSFLYFLTLSQAHFLIVWVELLVLFIGLHIPKNPFNAQFHETVFMEYKFHIPALE